MEHNDELKRWLRQYTVAAPDDALVERILLHAQSAEILPFTRPSAASWYKSAAMFAAMALFGFWIGNVTLPDSTHYASVQAATSGRTTLERMTGEPGNFKEIVL